MKCNNKIKLTPEEEKLLNEHIYNILCEGLDIVRARFPNINDFTAKHIEEKPQSPQPESNT